ncbi:MAG TPA: ABC transporter transmembrane domain-containing protein [Rhizobacter sp.]|nr:ABC transporter transmembrane domain-containing protein [Rhizobacter sp.]
MSSLVRFLSRPRPSWAGLGTALSSARTAAGESLLPLLLASSGINILALALPTFILQVYDRVLPNQAMTTLVVLIIGLTVALALDSGLRLLRAQLTTWSVARLEHGLRMRAVEKLLRAPLQCLEAESAGTHLERVNAVTALRDLHGAQIFLALVDLPFGLLFLALIAYLGGALVLVPVASLLAFGFAAAAVGRALRASVDERAQADQRRHDFLIQVLRGIHTVKALALDALLPRRHERLQEASASALARVVHQGTMAQTLGLLFSQINLVAIVAFGALSVLDGRLTMGGLAACTLLAGRALQPLQSAMGLWTSLQALQVARGQLDAVLAMPAEAAPGGAMPAIRGGIELRDLAWRPSADRPLLLDGIDLTVQPGEIVAIEGDTGAGKSSLLLTMMGLLAPERGSVRIDGEDIAAIAPGWLRRHVALLPQDGVIHAGTLIENLTHFRDGEIVNEALTLAGLLGVDQAVKRWPEGFDSRIGVGEVLPAGLAQRIAIIRELVKAPKLVLFDDADRALDADSCQRLAALLRQMARQSSVIVVSAKPVFLQLATRRYRLCDGQLQAVATEKLLMKEAA